MRAVARRFSSGDTASAAELAAVFCTTGNPAARAIAGDTLSSPLTPEQAGILCRESLYWQDDDLFLLVREKEILPPSMEEQALFLFCVGRLDEFRSMAGEPRLTLLPASYAAAPATVRALACAAARKNSTTGILATALSGTPVTKNAARWTYSEWEVVVEGFMQDGRHHDLWLLAPLAPLPLAITALSALKAAAFTPPVDELPVFEDLIRTLPDRWSYPVPPRTEPLEAGGPAGRTVRLAFAPDGSLLAEGSCDGRVTIRRTTAAGPATGIVSGDGPVRALALSADPVQLIAIPEDGRVLSFSIDDGSPRWTWEGTRQVRALHLVDNLTVLIGDEDGWLHVLDLHDGRALHTIPLHPSPVTCIAHAGDQAAMGHADGTVTIARPGSGSPPAILHGPDSAVRSIAFHDNGSSCLAIHEQGGAVLWDPESGERVRSFAGHAGRVTCSAVAGAGSLFVLGGTDHQIRCYSPDSATPFLSLPLYSRQLTACALAPDGSLLAACFHDGTIRICGMPDGRLLREFKGHKKAVATCTIAPDSRRLATAGWDGATRLFRLPNLEPLRTWDAHAGGNVALAGPAGTLLACVTADGIARLIDGHDGRMLRALDLYTPSVRAAALSPDGRYLAVAGADASLRFWDVQSGDLVSAVKRLKTSLRCLSFFPGLPTLIGGGWDGALRSFSATDGSLLRTWSGHSSIITCCAVSPDGSIIVTGSNDTTIRLWRQEEDAAYRVIRGWRSEIGAVAVSPYGTLIAAGGSDGVIRLYRLPHGIPAGEIPGILGTVTSLAFDTDGCMLLAGYDTGVMGCYSIPEERLACTIAVQAGSVAGLAILPRGTCATAGSDGICRFHAFPQVLFPARAGLAELPAAGGGNGDALHHAFIETLLAARFRDEIGLCPAIETIGLYDIQIVG